MDSDERDIIVPVVREQVHADAVPVETGSVRVTKQVESHEEILEQELRKGRVEVKRIKADRVVDGPQQVYRSGNTLVVPVVSEVLRVEKQWVVIEEIHITQLEDRETVQQKVIVSEEQARVERLDEQGNVVSTIAEASNPAAAPRQGAPESIVGRTAGIDRGKPGPGKRVLSSERSLLRDRPTGVDRKRR